MRIWRKSSPGRFRRRFAGLLLLALALSTPAPADHSLTGQMLVAVPSMRDPNFAKTVIYLLRHDHGGALGLVVNRPLGEVPLTVLLEGKDAEDQDGARALVLRGGPVNPRILFSLHSNDLMPGGSKVVKDGLAYTVEPHILRALKDGKGPKQSLFTLGYSGWAAGQLEAEIERGDWFIIPLDKTLVFGDDHADKWERAVAEHTTDL